MSLSKKITTIFVFVGVIVLVLGYPRLQEWRAIYIFTHTGNGDLLYVIPEKLELETIKNIGSDPRFSHLNMSFSLPWTDVVEVNMEDGFEGKYSDLRMDYTDTIKDKRLIITKYHFLQSGLDFDNTIQPNGIVLTDHFTNPFDFSVATLQTTPDSIIYFGSIQKLKLNSLLIGNKVLYQVGSKKITEFETKSGIKGFIHESDTGESYSVFMYHMNDPYSFIASNVTYEDVLYILSSLEIK